MRKIIIIICIIIIVIITGCDINNTPISKVEEYLTKYQTLDKSIIISYNDITNNTLSKEEIKQYENLIKKQYQNLVYEIKEETIDGDSAKVEVEIEVLNYKKIIEENQTNTLEKLKKTKKRITYKLNFNLIKNKDNKWILEEPNNEDKLKLLGMK